jgi:hypothetical protein
MSKSRKLAERKEIDRQERIAQTKQLIEDLGEDFKDNELPPEEVSQKEVKKSIFSTFKSFVPYTNEYYEALKAEEEMDDLKGIRIEKVIAKDLLNMTKTGLHEEALEQMMSETNNDFYYFNRLRTKLESEGKLQLEKVYEDPFSKLEKGVEKNRLKKAFRLHYSTAYAEENEDKLEFAEEDETPVKKVKKRRGCGWKGRNEKGEQLKCINIVIRKKANEQGMMVEIEYCPYHTRLCTDQSHVELDEPTEIRTPNAEALCSECYINKMRKQPPMFTVTTCPGLQNTTLTALGLEADLIEKGKHRAHSEEGTEDGRKWKRKVVTTCQWRPNPNNEELFGYMCNNNFFQLPAAELKKGEPPPVFDCCAYHLSQCYREHPVGASAVIVTPNEYGLCDMHYLAEFGDPPLKIDAVHIPGVVKGKAKDFWRRTKGRHWASPKSDPIADIYLHTFEVEPKPVDFIESIIRMNKRRLIRK